MRLLYEGAEIIFSFLFTFVLHLDIIVARREVDK